MKLLVVGAGSIGKRHVANACRLAEVLVYDEQRERIDELVQKYNVSACYSFESAIQQAPEAAIVATPHTSHVEQAMALIEAGCDVMVEKPIADDLAAAQQLVDLANESNRLLKVVCNLRFHPGPANLKTHLNEIGKAMFARAHFGQWLPDMRANVDYRQLYCAQNSMAGGVVLDNIHEFDYLLWILGSIKRVQSSVAHISSLEMDVEDYASINLLHANDVHSSIQLDYLRTHKRRGCEIVGSEGSLLWQSEGVNPESCSVCLYRRGECQVLYESADLDSNEMYITLLEKFLNAVNGEPVSDLLDGDLAIEELKAALQARSSFSLPVSSSTLSR